MRNPLFNIVQAQKSGKRIGVYSVCSSNSFVIKACLERAIESEGFVLIESTSNQVNQFGGYTGMNPGQFLEYVRKIAEQVGFPTDRILLGGDHLGPNVWRNESARRAMHKSCRLVADCVKSGYSKIHLDASMKCADDNPSQPLDIDVIARRAAMMCQAAEEAFEEDPVLLWKPCYIIGTEVPIPGGSLSGETELTITRPIDAQETIGETRNAFYDLGLEEAWERVIGIVVQPGVEFGDDSVINYDREAARQLSKFIEGHDHLVFEAHSTDYQMPDLLREMVEDHFAILKVGPALTFSFREALFALENMEQELLFGRRSEELSNLQFVVENVMLAKPESWIEYYQGDEAYLRFARKYSYSDRVRYYWANKEVSNSLQTLLSNLSKIDIPQSLLSMFMPEQYRKVIRNELENVPRCLISDKIQSRIEDYIFACNA
jgi:D-tagatose-1,6-bisphosphate aldolase subunit GatZ/KbaZ